MAIDLSGYKYLLFDVDETILDFKAAEKLAFINTFKKFKIDYKEEYYNIYTDINLKCWEAFERGELTRSELHTVRFPKLFDKIGVNGIDGKEVDKFYLNDLGYHGVILNHSDKILAKLAPKFDLYIITNGNPETQYRRLRDTDIEKYFKALFISEEMKVAKPNKEFFEYIKAHIEGFDYSKALVIGDSLTSDIKGANNAGIDACWLNRFNKKNDLGLNIKYEIKSLDELL